MTNVIFTEYTSIIAKQYRGYLELKHSIQDFELFVNFYIENYSMEMMGKRMEQGLVNDNSFLIPVRCAFHAIIMMYARFFDTRPDRRLVKLDEQGFPEDLKEYHFHLLSVRNQFVAHAGYSMYEDIRLLVGMKTDGQWVTDEDVVRRVILGAGQGDFELKLTPLMQEIKNKITKKLKKLDKKIEEELGSLQSNPKAKMYIDKKIFNNERVSQDDVEHFSNDNKNHKSKHT